ncbi:MAG: SpoIIE family protein phosphatase [Sphingobacteriaceae bacterium]|jgi:sigma-B regulation protein RsbU (phosphoserine phosphatase)|nr:SpoIIE family protein phosphatase [Sphingobacteriaceae bacterium]
MPAEKKILLVDDSFFMLELMGRAMVKEGFYCLKAESVEEAFRILAVEKPDIIISDYEMPVTNGFLFRQKLLEDNSLKDIPFIFFTSFDNEEMMMQGLDLQAVDYIGKDTPIPVIISKVNNLLSTVREQHERSLQELRITAEALNLRSVPQQSPQINGFGIEFWHKTFQNYPGGDFIDFIQVDDQYTFIVLGDVMGKKWGAWFFSFNFLSYIRSAVRLCVLDGNVSTASILQKINNVICLDPVLSDVLSTLSLIQLENKTGKLLYSGAGDLPLVYYNAEEDKVRTLASAGLLLGLFPDGGHDEHAIQLKPGDKLVAITDGMIDFEDEAGKKSDYNLFVELVSPVLAQPNSFEKIKNVTFLKDNSKEQVDDCSMVFIEMNLTLS